MKDVEYIYIFSAPLSGPVVVIVQHLPTRIRTKVITTMAEAIKDLQVIVEQ